MKKVFSTETTTDGRTLLYCSVGDGTGDVEVIEFPEEIKGKNCDCKYELTISHNGICKKCEERFYRKVLLTPNPITINEDSQ